MLKTHYDSWILLNRFLNLFTYYVSLKQQKGINLFWDSSYELYEMAFKRYLITYEILKQQKLKQLIFMFKGGFRRIFLTVRFQLKTDCWQFSTWTEIWKVFTRKLMLPQFCLYHRFLSLKFLMSFCHLFTQSKQ